MQARRGTRHAPSALVLLVGLMIACTAPSGSGGAPAPPPAVAPASGAAPTAPAAPAAPAPLVKSKAAYTTIAAGAAPWWMALEGGYLREQGLDVELLNIGAGATILAALRNGEIDVAGAGGSSFVAGYAQGLETFIFGATSDILDSFLTARPEIQAPADLRGKTVGVSRLKSVSDFATRFALLRAGLQPDVDVFIRATGGNAESLAALETGTADAATFGVPVVFDAEKRGFRSIVDIAGLKIPFLQGGVGATRQLLDGRPEMADAYLRALARANSRLRTDRDFAVQVMAKYTQLDDRQVLGATVDYYRPLYLLDLYPEPAAVQTVLEIDDDPAVRSKRPAEVTDTRPAERVRQSGFFANLPG